MTLGLVATLGPWLVRSLVLTGQVPGLELLRDSLSPAAGARPRSLANLPLFGVGRSPALLASLPWELTFNTHRFGENPPGFVGVAPLLALPAVAFVPRCRASAALAVLALVPLVLWFFSAQYLRYLMPALALSFVLVACGVEAVLERVPRQRALLAGLLLAALAVSPVVYLLAVLSYPGGLPVRHVLGADPADRYLARTLPQVPVLQRLAGLVAPGTPVAAYPEGYQMYSDAALLGIHSGAPWLVWARTASEVLELFERNGIAYFMVDHGSRATQRSRAIALSSSFLQEHAVTVYADRNVYLYRLQVKGAVSVESRELLLNPAFETEHASIPEAWNPTGSPVYDTSGSRAYAGRAAVQVKTSDSFSQAVSVQPGRPYVLSHFSRCDGGFDFIRLQVNWLDTKGAFLFAAIEVRRAGPTWAKQTMWAQAPGRAAFGVVYIASHDEAPCWFDEASFKEAP
jgi:hypothetical protein